MSLDSLITDFLEYLQIEKGFSPLTIREYQHYLKRFYDWLRENYPDTKPADINLEVIRKYRIYLAHFRIGTINF